MAHAGTPTDLAKQPATSTTNGLLQALLAAIVLMAVVAGTILIGTNVARTFGVPAADNRIDAQRGPTTAAAALIYAEDYSYTQAEKNRGDAFSAAAAPRIEPQRGPTTAAAALVYVGDDSYTQVEKNRGGATFGGQTAPGQPGQHEGGFGGQ